MAQLLEEELNEIIAFLTTDLKIEIGIDEKQKQLLDKFVPVYENENKVFWIGVYDRENERIYKEL
jgi:hypothetical protein